MTKVIDPRNTNGTPKPISFTGVIGNDGGILSATNSPCAYDNVQLVCLNYFRDHQDLIKAWDDGHEWDKYAVLYIGKWNGGFVESN